MISSDKGGRAARDGNGYKGGAGGRPSSFTPAGGLQLVAMMRAGNYLETAASCVGRSISVVRNWRRRGVRELQAFRRGDQQPFCYGLAVNGYAPNVHALLEFLALVVVLTDPVQWILCEREWFAMLAECLTLAEGEAEARSLSFVQKASGENPQAAMWFLSRRYPERWGQKTDVKVSGDAGAPVGVIVLPPEDPNG